MKKYFLTVFLLFFILLNGNVCFSQNSVSISLDIFNLDRIQTLYVSDFDILQEGTNEELFRITISNSGSSDIPGCQIRLELSKDNKILAYVTTKSFELPPGAYSFTNVQLNQGEYTIGGQTIRVKESKMSEEDIGSIQENILSSGKAPVGVYKIVAMICINNSTVPEDVNDSAVDEFIITNPSFVQLVSPGSLAGYGLPEDIYTEFPVFQWNGNGEKYQVLVFEKKGSSQSIDEILGGTPNWKTDPGEDPLTSLSVQYNPGSGSIPLEFGKTYYWLTKMFVETSSGEEKINSEVWQFCLVDPVNFNNKQGLLTKETLLNFLRDILGDRVDDISQSLTDFHLQTISVNGQNITVQELYEILKEYKGTDVEVLDLLLQSSN